MVNFLLIMYLVKSMKKFSVIWDFHCQQAIIKINRNTGQMSACVCV